LKSFSFKGGRPNVNAVYTLGGAGDVYVEVSIDGVTWRRFGHDFVVGLGRRHQNLFKAIAYPYVRARTERLALT